MSEASSWSTLRTHLMLFDGKVHIQRFEDKLTGGIPDCNVCWTPVGFKAKNSIEFWMEGKFVKELPKRATTKVKVGLRPDQALWLETRQRAGGNAFVWVRIADVGWQLWSSRFRALQDGIPANEFLQEPVYSTCKDMARLLRVLLISEPLAQ